MIANKPRSAASSSRVVITGIGLTAPNGNSLSEYRQNLLAGRSGVKDYEIRYFGKTLAGVCDFDPLRHQPRRDVRRGTRAGSVAIYCAHEAVQDSGTFLHPKPWPLKQRACQYGQKAIPSTALGIHRIGE